MCHGTKVKIFLVPWHKSVYDMTHPLLYNSLFMVLMALMRRVLYGKKDFSDLVPGTKTEKLNF